MPEPTPELEQLRLQLQQVLEEIDACPEKVERTRVYSAKMVPLLTDPVLSDLERYAYLDRAWDYCKFPKEVAKDALKGAVIDRLIDPILANVRVWRESLLLTGVLPPDPGDVTTRAGDTIKGLASLERKVRDEGLRYLLTYLTDLRVPNAKPLVDDLLAAALSPADEVLDPEQLRLDSAEVLAHPDPLVLIMEEIRRVYGGDIVAPLLAYLSMSSRVLELREGGLLLHLQLLGAPSTGKTWAYKTAKRLFPPVAVLEYQSGTPRVLIYDSRSLVHRVIIFSEVGSIPTDADHQPVATALRKLVEENRLVWDLVVRDEKTGRHVVEGHHREGPTVLITTGTRRMEAQMDSRLFVYELPEDAEQNRRSILMQTRLEEGRSTPAPSAALIAYQGLLQTMAPFQVAIPFVPALGTRLAELGGVDSRVRRDVLKVFTLVKTVALLRFSHRKVVDGVVQATVEDYQFVRDLVASQYIVGGGPTDRVREVVEMVAILSREAGPGQPVTASAVSKRIGISGPAGWGHIQRAIQAGWIINAEYRKGMPANLQPGEALPGRINLPSPEDLDTVLGQDLSTPPHPGENAPEANRTDSSTINQIVRRLGTPLEAISPPKRTPAKRRDL